MEFSQEWIKNRLTELLGGSNIAEIAATVVLLVVTLFFYWIIWLATSRVVKRLHKWVADNQGSRIRGLTIQKQKLFSESDITRMLHGLIRILGWVAKLVLFMLAVNTTFAYFDWTRNAAMATFGYVGEIIMAMVTSLVAYLPNLVVIVVVLFIARFVIHVTRLVFDGLRKERIHVPHFYPEWSVTSFNLIRLMIIVITLIIIFPYLPGSDSPAFQGLSIFFGVLLSLGSSSAVANVIAGVVITYTRAFKIGDRVRIADTEGDVVERSSFVTRIRTPKNVEVAIPNSMVMSNHIVNYSAQAEQEGLLLHTTVTIGYDVPWPTVHKLLLEAASRTAKLEAEPEPFVLQTALDDNYVAYELNVCTREASGKQSIYSDLHANIQDCFHGADVEILSPHYRATRDGNERAIPKGTT